MLLAIAIVFVETLAFQILLGFAQSVMMIIAIGLIEPYKEKAKWWKELANEQVILATLYFAMCFSDLIPSAATQSLVGYAFCGMLAAHIGSYLLMISVTTIRTTF